MNATKLVIITAALALFIVACGQSTKAPDTPTANSNKGATASSPAAATANAAPPGVDPGTELYAQNCQICHKDSGKGGKNLTIEGKKISPADLTSDKAKKHTDEDLTKDILEGAPDDGMPAFKDKLKPDQIKLIIGHIRRLQAGTVPASL